MIINERTVALASSDDGLQASEVGWFAAKQPGLLRFIEDRLAGEQDALAMAVDLCWRVVAAFEQQHGLPLARIHTSELERAEEEVVRESQGQLVLANGCAHRQPELSRWLEAALMSPALPIDKVSLDRIALLAAATISACDRAHLPVPTATDADASAGVLID